MRDQDRLRRTKVRVGRHQRVAGASRLTSHGTNDLGQRLLQRRDTTSQIQAQVERHLFVARSSRVQAFAGVAQLRHKLSLDKAMHILIVSADECRIGSPVLEHLCKC